MPLTIGHDDAELIGAPLERLFLPVQGAEIEDGDSSRVLFDGSGHTEERQPTISLVWSTGEIDV